MEETKTWDQHRCWWKAETHRSLEYFHQEDGERTSVCPAESEQRSRRCELPFTNQVCLRSAGLWISTQVFIKSATCVAQRPQLSSQHTHAHLLPSTCCFLIKECMCRDLACVWGHTVEVLNTNGLKWFSKKKRVQRLVIVWSNKCINCQSSSGRCHTASEQRGFISFTPKAACKSQPNSLFPQKCSFSSLIHEEPQEQQTSWLFQG